ncbi:MAG: hypothetical protein WCC01_12240 [Acidimicrobiia bacterium]
MVRLYEHSGGPPEAGSDPSPTLLTTQPFERTGEASFYGINALSNFIADAPTVIGFDPFANLVDFIVERARTSVHASV